MTYETFPPRTRTTAGHGVEGWPRVRPNTLERADRPNTPLDICLSWLVACSAEYVRRHSAICEALIALYHLLPLRDHPTTTPHPRLRPHSRLQPPCIDDILFSIDTQSTFFYTFLFGGAALTIVAAEQLCVRCEGLKVNSVRPEDDGLVDDMELGNLRRA